MTLQTPDPADTIWDGIDDQRGRTADLLEQLTDEQWEHPSLCEGWTVRHVAAHLTLQQQHVGDAIAFISRHPRMLRSLTLNAAIHDSALIVARELSSEQIVARIRSMIGSRRHNVGVTPLDTLTDTLVHGQDLAVPLGLDLPIVLTAGQLAATRRWDTRGSWLDRVFDQIPLDGYRLRATDTDWTRGEGLEVTGPISAILLLLTGRPVALDQLTGPGVDSLRPVALRS